MGQVIFALPLLALLAALCVRRRRRAQRPASAVIMSPRKSTLVAKDGAVRSVQSAEFSLREEDLARLWTPQNLENLARTYWRFLTRVTLGLIRVQYGEHERSVVLLTRPLTLLRFSAPEYTIQPERGIVRWAIRDGLLVARAGRGSGFLQIEVRRLASPRDPEAAGEGGLRRARVYAEVEVANFYPAIAAGFSLPVYMATQSWVHVMVTHGFLRSMARLRFARSRVGVLAGAGSAAGTAASAAAQAVRDAVNARTSSR
jgi:hypothetical protein